MRSILTNLTTYERIKLKFREIDTPSNNSLIKSFEIEELTDKINE